MTNVNATADQTAVLAALAAGIIPPDERDDGAASVNAGPRLAEKLAAGTAAPLYRQGLEAAEAIAREMYGRPVAELNPEQVHALVGALRQRSPAFFKQLRTDVSALYLSDENVWRRIGFPGPSTELGGYPDFDQPQA